MREEQNEGKEENQTEGSELSSWLHPLAAWRGGVSRGAGESCTILWITGQEENTVGADRVTAGPVTPRTTEDRTHVLLPWH